MIRNYLLVAWRSLKRNPVHTTINVVGLSVAMATCLLIGLYLQSELRHDAFHPNADRITTVGIVNKVGKPKLDLGGPSGLKDVLASKVPGVQQVTQTKRFLDATVRYESENRSVVQHPEVLAADSSFFDVLSGFRVEGVSSDDVFDAPNEAVITPSLARDLFGDRDPIGKTVALSTRMESARGYSARQYTIVGITEVPTTSSITFDLLVSAEGEPPPRMPWFGFRYETYARTEGTVTPDHLSKTIEAALPPKAEERLIKRVEAIPLPNLYLSEAHTVPGFKANPNYLYVFGTVAVLILLIASLNYVTLVTAQTERRTREIGIRKTVGAGRGQVAQQFVLETTLLTLIALVLAAILTTLALPAFNAVFRTSLQLTDGWSLWALLRGTLFILTVILLASTYPALVLSGFRPKQILRGKSATTSSSGGWLRKGLVVTQFAVTAGLIFGTVIVYQQLDYLQTKDLGFDGEQVLAVKLGEVSASRQQSIKEQSLSHPAIQQVAIGDAVPGSFDVAFGDISLKTLSPVANVSEDRKLTIYIPQVDTNYIETLGLNLVAGRRFADVPRGKRDRTFLINETTANLLGWSPEGAVGKPLTPHEEEGTIIGVVKDFHFESMRKSIAPVALTLGPNQSAESSIWRAEPPFWLVARLGSGDVRSGVDHLREVTGELAPETSFSYAFLDDRFDQMYRTAERLGRVFAGFAGIALVLACMGLFGLAAYAAQRRTREIGIRKALGATAMRILGRLSWEYASLMAVALLVGTPLAYLGIQRWLQDFAYRINVGIGTLASTVALVVFITAGSVSYHVLQAAWTDPATAIRQE